jgi:2-C-methyl-D-erythritol 4-phosphate cytidylyltransferase
VAEAAWSFGAATAAVPVVDTLRRVVGEQQSSDMGRGEPGSYGESSVGGRSSAGTICGELDRKGVWHIQTPQAFGLELLSRAHEAAKSEATDDTSLVTPFHPVQIVAGSRFSFKITTPEDLEFAEALSGI